MKQKDHLFQMLFWTSTLLRNLFERTIILFVAKLKQIGSFKDNQKVMKVLGTGDGWSADRLNLMLKMREWEASGSLFQNYFIGHVKEIAR